MTASMAAVPAAVIPAPLSVASLTFLIAGISVTEISPVLVAAVVALMVGRSVEVMVPQAGQPRRSVRGVRPIPRTRGSLAEDRVSLGRLVTCRDLPISGTGSSVAAAHLEENEVLRTALLTAGLAVLVGLTACGSDDEADPADLGEGPAFVEDVVVEARNGEYWATVSGFYPDACSIYGGSEQQVDGDTITLTVTSTRPDDAGCAQVLTDMTEEILLDTDGLAPGRYEVVVNQGRSTTFTIR